MRTPISLISAGLMTLAAPALAETSPAAPETPFAKPTLIQFAPPSVSGTPAAVSSQSRAGLGGTVNWTGFYGGVQAGIGFVDTNRSGTDEDIMGGFTLGYDHDFGQWVLGGALDYDFADIDAGPNNAIEEIFRVKAAADTRSTGACSTGLAAMRLPIPIPQAATTVGSSVAAMST